jgi:anaerobic selenocysteine-containing dehydrogenase
MPDVRTATCNLCDAMCGLLVEVEGNTPVKVRGDPDDPHSKGHICPKAVGMNWLVTDPDRVRTPLVRENGALRPASWDEALERATQPLIELRRKYGPDAIALYVGNPVIHTHNTALAAQFLTTAFGTRNRFDPNSQDGNPRLFACMAMFGNALAMPVPDVDRCEFLLLLGTNPAVSHGSQMSLGDARKRLTGITDRGGTIVLLDPRRTETAAWATRHHFIRPGTDAALLLALLHVIFARGLERPHPSVVRLDALKAIAARFPPERVAAACGIPAAEIEALAVAFASSKAACAHARVGVCVSAFGPVACWLTDALNVVTGNLDRVGGALFPRPAIDLAPWGPWFGTATSGRWRSRVRGLPEFLGVLPSGVLSEEIETPGDGQIRALICLAGNPVSSTPNGERLGRALAGLEHVVAIDLYVNETSRHAHVVLPPRHSFETGAYDVLMGALAVRHIAKYNAPIVEPPPETRQDWDIATELVLRARVPRALWGLGRRLLRGLPDRTIDGMLRLGPQRLSLAKLRSNPHGLDLGPLEAGRWTRPVDVAPEALIADLPRLEASLLAAPDLVMIGRRDVRSNNSWLHNVPALVKGQDRARLRVHPDDAARLGLVGATHVRATTRTGDVVLALEVTDEMMPGVVSLPHGFGHQAAKDTLSTAGALPGVSANVLTDELLLEPIVGTSILNGVPIALSREGSVP